MDNSIDFTRVKNDVNGNPRYVCHWLTMASTYDQAIKLANSIGGRKYHNKSYGGGLVFQSYSIDRLIVDINHITGKAYTSHTITR
jgi:hypothetical protein